MKKRGTLKKFLSLALSSMMLISMLSTAAVSAEESEEDNESELYLIRETETVLEDGTIVIDRYYSDSPELDAVVYSTAAASGTKTDRHTKKFIEKQSDGTMADIVTIWVQATFTWNSADKSATVDKNTIKTGCTIHASGLTKIDEEITYGSNQGSEDIFGLGHIYAYARYRVQLRNTFSYDRVYEVYTDRNRLGEQKQDDGSSKGTLSLNQNI